MQQRVRCAFVFGAALALTSPVLAQSDPLRLAAPVASAEVWSLAADPGGTIDAGGYGLRDCADAGGPASAFVDISGSGAALGLSDDGEANIVLPFSFPFYDTTTADIRVANNGALLVGALAGDVLASNAGPLPVASGGFGPGIMPFWDDIDADTGNVYWQSMTPCPNPDGGAGVACAIIQWDARPHYSNVGSATFQVLLYANGSILFHYLDVAFGNAGFDGGASATIGIQGDSNVAANKFVQYAFNQPGAVVAGCPILISLTPAIELRVTATPNSNGTPGDECGVSDFITVAAGTEVEVCYSIRNVGGVTLTRHTLTDPVPGIILSAFPYILPPGASAFITVNRVITIPTIFTGTWTAFNPGPVDETSDAATGYVDVTGAGGFPIFADGFEDPPPL